MSLFSSALYALAAYAATVSGQVSTLAPASGNVTSDDVKAFCSSRPVGLYCSPWSVHQKIECPSGEFFTCPKAPSEYCQERGILKTSGYKGGIARCVPYLDPVAVQSFCDTFTEEGTYCYGDSQNNIRIQCPTGLIYKCDNNPTADTKKCDQTRPNLATCKIGGGGGVVGECTSLLLPPVTVTETVSATCPAASTVTVTATEAVFTTFLTAETVTESATGDMSTVTSTLTLTSTGGPGAVATSVSVLEPSSTPTPTPGTVSISCNGTQQVITTPPGLNVTYQFVADPSSESDARTKCTALGGQLLSIGSSDEHWRLGQLICSPVWYSTWEGNSYSDPNACIALFPGGATAVPSGGCTASLPAICSIPK